MKRLLAILALVCSCSCSDMPQAAQPSSSTTTTPPPPTTLPPPTSSSIDGLWVILVNIPDPLFEQEGACIQISRGAVVAWYDACDLTNSKLLAPATIFYDDVGPWFVAQLEGFGGEGQYVYLWRTNDDRYDVELSAFGHSFFGVMDRM